MVPKFIYLPYDERSRDDNLITTFKNHLRIVPMII